MTIMFVSLTHGNIIAQTDRPVLSDGNIHHVILSDGRVVELHAARWNNMRKLSPDDCEQCGVLNLCRFNY